MNGIQSKILLILVFFVAIFLSGYWLAKSGQPLSSLKLTIHKLIAVAALIYLIVMIKGFHRLSPLSKIQFIACIVAGVLFLITIASGGLLSINKPMPALVKILHHIIAYLVILSTGWLLYLVFSRAVNT